jgi:hypothetical protein
VHENKPDRSVQRWGYRHSHHHHGLELKAPHDPTPTSLAKMWPTFFAYVLSFIIIAIYWVNHHHLIHLVTRIGFRHPLGKH